MIRSMTGFGRCEKQDEFCRLTVELRSVNHRYLDLNLKMPRLFNPYESEIRNRLKAGIERGKVDVFITYETFADTTKSLHYNAGIAAEYMKILREACEQFQLAEDMTAAKLMRLPDVISEETAEEDEDKLTAILFDCLDGALKAFSAQKESEGAKLAKDLEEKISNMEVWVSDIEKRSPEVVEEYRERIYAKVRELLSDTQIDPGRMAAEVTLYADKICVDEETVRLRSHFDAVRKALKAGGSVGRKLDFLAQELNREANTILSKSGDLAVSDAGISLKTEIEKLREQIQNIE